MKERKFSAFETIQSLLDRSLNRTKDGLEIRIRAAKKQAGEILENCIQDNYLKSLLNLPAFSDDPGRFVYNILGDEALQMSLLEQIICIGIQKSQDPDTAGLPSSSLVGIRRADLEKIGYIPGKKFDQESEKILSCTNGFIKISAFNASTRTDAFVFLCTCNFTVKLPMEKSLV